MAHALKKDMNSPEIAEVSLAMELTALTAHTLFDRNEVHEVYAEWRKVFNEYDPPRFGVAEGWVPERQYLYASKDDLGQIFNFSSQPSFGRAITSMKPLKQALKPLNVLVRAQRGF